MIPKDKYGKMMKFKLALLLAILMTAFMSTFAFAEDQYSKQAELDWRNTIDNFLHEVKVAEGFDYSASENASLWKSLDIEVKKLGNNKEYWNKDSLFFLCEAHKKVMRQFYKANYELVKLGNLCASSSLAAENWLSIGKFDGREDFINNWTKDEKNIIFLKKKYIFLKQQHVENFDYQISINSIAVNCNEGTVAYTAFTFQDNNGQTTYSVEIPKEKWEFDKKTYYDYSSLCNAKSKQIGGNSAVENRGAPQKNTGYSASWKSFHKTSGVEYFIDTNSIRRADGLTSAWEMVEINMVDEKNTRIHKTAVINNVINCNTHRVASGSIRLIDKNENGDVIKSGAFKANESEFLAAEPDSPGDKLINFACAANVGASIAGSAGSSGSGFFVNNNGYLLTNNHVVNGCSILKIRDSSKIVHDVTVIATDARNDLALLKTSTDTSFPAVSFRTKSSVESGESVVALGYPLAGVLSSEANVSFGYVSATAGLADDTSKLQISAPIQPGNSGGPLLDQSGNLIGVVVAKLDAIKVAKAIGDIPQNINFAVKGEVAQVFLNAHKVRFKSATATKKQNNTEIASQGRAFTVLVECWK